MPDDLARTQPPPHAEQLIRLMYAAFADRDLDAVLAGLAPQVDWPNEWRGGRVVGRVAVREYWTGQWNVIDPRLDVIDVVRLPDGRVAVTVHQVIRDRDGGRLVSDDLVRHVLRFDDGLIARMDVDLIASSPPPGPMRGD